ncbi:MAG: hypothetical protein R3F43_23315 [bacterium]
MNPLVPEGRPWRCRPADADHPGEHVATGRERRLQASDPTAAEEEVAIASVAEDAYCTPRLKGIVRRVAGACRLGDSRRGCQPMRRSGGSCI